MSLIILWLITTILLGGGLVGTVIPGLPGITITYLGILIYAFATHFARISHFTVIVFGIITVVTLLSNYLGSMVGSRLGGGKKWAIFGTLVGAVVGIFGGPSGLLLGAFVGAFIGALLEGKSGTQPLKVAFFSILGIVGSTIIQLLLTVLLVIAFLLAVIF